MTSVNEKHANLQQTLESERISWANDKRLLEGAIVDMTTSERSSESDRASHQQEVRQLEERAKAADERYSREVVAHAESIKSVEDLRTQLAKAKATARDSLAASETAQSKLATSETSWKQQKDALDKEVADLNTRYSPFRFLFFHHVFTLPTDARASLPRITSFISISSLSALKQRESDRLLTLLRLPRLQPLKIPKSKYTNFVLWSHPSGKRRRLSTCNLNSVNKRARASRPRSSTCPRAWKRHAEPYPRYDN